VDVTATAVRSMFAWIAKALPVAFWHTMQWHAKTKSGGFSSLKVTCPQGQLPVIEGNGRGGIVLRFCCVVRADYGERAGRELCGGGVRVWADVFRWTEKTSDASTHYAARGEFLRYEHLHKTRWVWMEFSWKKIGSLLLIRFLKRSGIAK
jgi:hypothetical protein